MTIGICPRCQQRYTYDGLTNSDYVHTCNSNKKVLDQEDIVVHGDWQDYTGSATVGKHSAQFKSMNNKLQLSRSKIDECEQLDEKSPRGANKGTHRQRQHEEYIDLRSACSEDTD